MSDNPDINESSSSEEVATVKSDSAIVASTGPSDEKSDDTPIVAATPRKRGRPAKPKSTPVELGPKRKVGRPRKIPQDESTRSDEGPPVKRPRGRPPKPKVQGPKRKPGRPRKTPLIDVQPTEKRPRGRPRKSDREKSQSKNPSDDATTTEEPTGEHPPTADDVPKQPSGGVTKRRPGRPRKHPESSESIPKEKRKRGRPRKIPATEALAVGEKRPRGRPRKRTPMVVMADDAVEAAENRRQEDGEPPRKRGRPRKVVKTEASVDELQNEYGSSEVPQIVLTNAEGSYKLIGKHKESIQ